MKQRADTIGIGFFALLIALLGFRIMRGADFGDESYYAIFIDDWLKGGIATSAFLTIHQTAALIVYPVTLVYSRLNGSSDGLFLFLRVLFLIGAAVSALFWVVLLTRLGYRLLAWAAGILVLSFVPFGLPAPSYNTLGQQGLTIALASFGCAALIDDQKREQFWWLAASACAWAVATVAYPTMVVPLGCLCLLGLLCRDGSFPRPWLYLALTASAICAGWSVVALSLTPTRLYDCIVFSSIVNFEPDALRRRLAFVHDTFAANLPFLILCLIAVIVGVGRRIFPLAAHLAIVAIVGSLFALTPTLFTRSHDAITLVALTGLGLLSGLRTGRSRVERVVGIVYATSLVAALTTCATAYNTVFNFSIGAMPAAVLALLDRPASRPFNIPSMSAILATIAAVLSTSLFFYYGELPGQPAQPRERIRNGFLSGLALVQNDAALIHLVQSRVNPLLETNQPIVLVGRMPGLVLVTPARLRMLIPYSIRPSGDAKQIAIVEGFYNLPGQQPSLVLVYRDDYFEPVNPIPRFNDRFQSAAKLNTPLGSLSIYQQR